MAQVGDSLLLQLSAKGTLRPLFNVLLLLIHNKNPKSGQSLSNKHFLVINPPVLHLESCAELLGSYLSLKSPRPTILAPEWLRYLNASLRW